MFEWVSKPQLKMPLSQEVKLALEIQQKAYRDLLEVVQSPLNKKIKHLETANMELTVSLQFTQKDMDELKLTCAKQSEKIDTLEKEIFGMKNKKYDEEMEMTKRLNYQEDYSRRNNLSIDGVEESPGENWEVTQHKVQRLIQEKLCMNGVQFERAHRVGPIPSRRRSTEASYNCGSFLPVL